MESIVLEVDEAIARAWKNSSPLVRAAYEDKINEVLRQFRQIEKNEEPVLTKEQQVFLKAEAANHIETFEWWKDEEFVAEMEKRAEDMNSGKVKGIAWEDVKSELLSRTKKNGK